MNILNNNFFIPGPSLIELSGCANQIEQDFANRYQLPHGKNELIDFNYTSFEKISKLIHRAENLKTEFTLHSAPRKFIEKLIERLTKTNNLINRIQSILDPQIEGASEENLEQVDPREIGKVNQKIRDFISSMPVVPHFNEEAMEGVLNPREIEILPRREERPSGAPCVLLMIVFTVAFLGFLSLLNGPGIRNHL